MRFKPDDHDLACDRAWEDRRACQAHRKRADRITRKRERAYRRWRLLSPIHNLTEDGRTVSQRAFDWLTRWDALHLEMRRRER
jgi:hypothetical protein